MNETTDRTGYAVVFTEREHAEFLPIERDVTPLGPKEVTGRALTTLISGGTEVAGGYLGATFPSFPGYAAVFEVEEVGSAVSDVEPGDRVFCAGKHRSFRRCERDEIVPVPAGLSPEVAVFARMMQVSMTTLATTTARPPAQVLVTGLGTVGHLAAQIFERCGYAVTAYDPVAARREIAVAAGIRHVVSALPADDPHLVGKVALVLECSGHEAAVLQGCKVVRKRGEVVTIGAPWRQHTDITAHDLLHAVFHRYIVLRSGWEWELPPHDTEFQPNSLFGNIAAALHWLAKGQIRVDSLYRLVAPVDAQSVYHDLLHQRFDCLTGVFDWTRVYQ